MKISEYIAALTANGLTEDAARGLAKGQAVALSLVDDIGLTMPLASGLVKGLVANGLDEESATESARVAIAKGKAVDDLAAPATEPVTAGDALAQLEAASTELVKGKKAQVEMELNGDEEDDDDDEDGDDGDDDGKPDGLDGDDRGKPDTMPAKAKKANGGYGAMKGEMFAQAMTDALAQVSTRLEGQFKELHARLDGIAKGVGTQGMAQAQAFRAMNEQTDAMKTLAKGMGEPRNPRGNVQVPDVNVAPHPSETVAGASKVLDRVFIKTAALSKAANFNDPELTKLLDLINNGADDAAIQASATKLGLGQA